jgi:glycine/D-amino acid oxidase-like deaminating enzyme
MWWEDIESAGDRPALAQDLDVDVAIVGAGYTGLWTAFALKQADPDIRVAILEREHVGFGASGRNGGFCYDGFAAGPERIEAMSDLATARDWGAALRGTIDIIGDVAKAHDIACDFHQGGTIEFLTNGGQRERAREDVESAHHYGWIEDDLKILSAAESLEIGRAADVLGGMWSPQSASIHPAKLAHGLADLIEGWGVQIFEHTAVIAIEQGVVTTAGGRVKAPFIVRATEGYTAELEGHKRRLAPLYSLMIATEPLSESLWEEIGLADMETFGDLRHLVTYGQRTADGRIAFGGRGAPYDYGSRVRRNAEFDVEAFTMVRTGLLKIFPQLEDTTITHRWGGVLGVTRNWIPTAGLDRKTGLAWAGGYVGAGVAVANLAGRTLADLIRGEETRLTRFPWVDHHVRKWEPEPFRWLGINGALQVMKRADAVEDRRGKAAATADWLWRIVKI